MKKVIYALILPLVVVSGLVFANREIKNETSQKSSPKPFSIADKKAGPEDRKKWEASSEGKKFKKWEDSPEGKKVHASGEKIMKYIKDSTTMEAVVTSLSRPPGSLCGLGVMVRINGEAYILNFWPERVNPNFQQFFQQVNTLKVNDKIVVKSYSATYLPDYPYPIISGDYVERNSKILFKPNFRNDG